MTLQENDHALRDGAREESMGSFGGGKPQACDAGQPQKEGMHLPKKRGKGGDGGKGEGIEASVYVCICVRVCGMAVAQTVE